MASYKQSIIVNRQNYRIIYCLVIIENILIKCNTFGSQIMSNNQENNNGAPVFGTGNVKGLFDVPKLTKKGREKRASKDLLRTFQYADFDDINFDSHNEELDVFDDFRYLISEMVEQGAKVFNKNLEIVSNLLLWFSLSNDTQVSAFIEVNLSKIVDIFAHDEKEFNKLYRMITEKHFRESQLQKLLKIHFGEAEPLESLTLEKKVIFIKKLIAFIVGRSTNKFLSKNDSVSFLALDNHIKEAKIWRELELKESGNEDYARLAGTIATKIWLFKEPLLKRYCQEFTIDFVNLSFSQRAELTKKALDHFSDDEITTILDGAVLTELNKRKQQFPEEKRVRFVGKRVSMGAEFETGAMPFELATNFAWYENIDRERFGDSVVFKDSFNNLFELLAKYRDLRETFLVTKSCLLEIEKIENDFSTSEIDQKKLTTRVNSLIAKIRVSDIKEKFIQYVESGGEVNLALVGVLKQFFTAQLKDSERQMLVARNSFYDFLYAKDQRRKYEEVAETSTDLLSSMRDEAHQLKDIFVHHLAESQAIGHTISADAHGELGADFVRGGLKDNYRFYSREIWELAKAGFHDLELESRPIHLTVGFKSLVDEIEFFKGDLPPRKKLEKQSKLNKDILRNFSIINFAFTVAGFANRSFVFDLKKQMAEKGKEELSFYGFTDTGRNQVLRKREDSESRIVAMEFRDFSPDIKNIPRLFESVGDISTAAKANLVIEHNTAISRRKFRIDRQLNKIWQHFENEVLKIYEMFPADCPDIDDANLFSAHSWSDSSSYSEKLRKVAIFYQKIITDWDKPDGVVALMRRLIIKTQKRVDKVFA